MDEALLSEKFLLYPKKSEAEVILTNDSIAIKYETKNKDDEIILLNDVTGSWLRMINFYLKFFNSHQCLGFSIIALLIRVRLLLICGRLLWL